MHRKNIIAELFTFFTSLMRKIKYWLSLCIDKLREAEKLRRKGETAYDYAKEQSRIDTRVALSKIQNQLDNFSFQSVFEPKQYESEWFGREIPQMATTEEQIKSLLLNIEGPYGINLLKPQSVNWLSPLLDDVQNRDNKYYDNRIKKIRKHIEYVHSKLTKDIERANKLREANIKGEKSAIEEIAFLTLLKYPFPEIFRGKTDILYDPENRIILILLEIPDLSSISIVKQKKRKYDWGDWVEISTRVQKKLKEDILYSLCIRTGYLVANSDTSNNVDLVTVNIKQNWTDPATGSLKTGTVASLQASKKDFCSLQLDRIEPKACFRHLKGVSTPSIENISAIKPIFDLDMNDRRIVENKQVSESLDPNANLAAMPWEDFEHLVRQLFEWEFGNKGIEVKVTCASRDRGVDAIMFDPDPLKGGKYVLQAKRYNRTVDVAAVRDLYGTVVNEGANRGILVTTSRYGPDTYEFANGKPISLVDGQHLVQMLTKHGKNYHIKLEK